MLGNIIRLYIHKQGSDFTLILTMTANKLIPVIVPIFGLLHLKSETYKLSIQNLVAIDIIKGSSYNVYQFQKNRNLKDQHIAQLSINHRHDLIHTKSPSFSGDRLLSQAAVSSL